MITFDQRRDFLIAKDKLVLEYIAENPGMPFIRIQKSLHLSTKVLKKTLESLLDTSQIKGKKSTHWYRQVNDSELEHNEDTRRILDAIEKDPYSDQVCLGLQHLLPVSSIYAIINALVKDGVITEISHRDIGYRYYIKEATQ